MTRLSLPLGCLLAAVLTGCTGGPSSTAIPADKDVPQLRPGMMAGYLDRKQLPDSRALLPPPPAPGSPAQAADDAAFRATVAQRNTPRWALARADNELRFPQAAGTFACALDATISPDTTPHLHTLLRRTLVDAGLSTYGAKDHYKRTRPFVAEKAPLCAPEEAERLAKDGSYPSGHSALGWAWALVLTQIAPERADALLQRGHAFGQSRVVCGAHWQSDVDQGRVMGAAAVARLQSDPVFRAQLDAARAEVVAQRAKGARPAAAACAAEAAALKP
jgi:acid phosphatase (class A)